MTMALKEEYDELKEVYKGDEISVLKSLVIRYGQEKVFEFYQYYIEEKTRLEQAILNALGKFTEKFDSIPENKSDYSIDVFTEIITESQWFITFKDTLYWYDPSRGVYVESYGVVEKLCVEIWDKHEALLRKFPYVKIRKLTDTFIKEVVSRVKIVTRTDKRYFHQVFDANPRIINVKNGLLLLEDDCTFFLPHTPYYPSVAQIPVKYNPNAKCPVIEKFITDVVTEPYKKTIIQLLAYCLTPGYRHNQAFMFVGSGENGKSTLLNLFTRFLGEENVSHVPLQQLASDQHRFARIQLAGKLANIYADIPKISLSETGYFKVLTGGDRITADRKFKNQIEFRNRAKLIFSANELPPVDDNTYAFWRRWILIRCPNKFEGDKKDPDIFKKITDETELSGLLNLVLAEYWNVYEKGVEYPEKDNLAEEWKRRSNSVYAFVQDCVVKDQEAFVPKDLLYSEYITYCEENQLAPVSKKVFSYEIPKLTGALTARPIWEGKRTWCWKGIKLKDFEESSSALYSKSPIDIITNLISTDPNNPTPIEEVLRNAEKENIKEDVAMKIIEDLKRNGAIYEPRAGFLARVY